MLCISAFKKHKLIHQLIMSVVNYHITAENIPIVGIEKIHHGIKVDIERFEARIKLAAARALAE